MHTKSLSILAFSFMAFSFSGCVDISSKYEGKESPPETPALSAPIAVSGALSLLPPKVFNFTWNDVPGADYYRLMENPDGTSGFSQVGGNILPGDQEISIRVPLFKRANSEYIIESCNDAGCTASSTLYPTSTLSEAVAYFKSSNPEMFTYMGPAISASYDGTTIAIGDSGSSNSGNTINGDVNDVSGSGVGSAHVYTFNGSSWDYDLIKASNADNNDYFGSSVALSEDGNTLAVGATGEDSNNQSTPSNNDIGGAGEDSGAVYVFSRSNGTWSQTAYLKASNLSDNADFGVAIDISANGETLLVGAIAEDSIATYSGAAYVFQYDTGAWTQEAFLKAHNPSTNDSFGSSLGLSADGNAAVIGAFGESSNRSGIFPGTSEAGDDSLSDSGAAYLFSRSGSSWSQDLFIKAPQPDSGDNFGISVDISGNGDTIAVGSSNEDSTVTGINGNEADNTGSNNGAVFVYSNGSGTWQKEAYIKPNVSDNSDQFGFRISLSKDGNTLATTAPREAGLSPGINGNSSDNSGSNVGAAYTFKRELGVWSQESYIKTPNAENMDFAGYGIALSGDGMSLLFSSDGEDGGSAYEGGDQSDNSVDDSGAVFLF